jgi:hypothetical protein
VTRDQLGHPQQGDGRRHRAPEMASTQRPMWAR